jgi:hypothetical protein
MVRLPLNKTANNIMLNTFNTGRHYSEDGQIIVWESQDVTIGDELANCGTLDESVYTVWFVDLTRNIDGVLTIVGPPTNEKVLAAYDRPGYSDGRPDDYAVFYEWTRHAAATAAA